VEQAPNQCDHRGADPRHENRADQDAGRQRNTVRRTLEGAKDREVIYLRTGALCLTGPSELSADAPDPHETGEMRTVSADGNGIHSGDCPQEPSAKQAEKPLGGRCGRSDAPILGFHDADPLTPEEEELIL